MIRSTYVHIPFCKKICSYCDFCKVFYDKKQVSLYLDALEYEIDNIYNKLSEEEFNIFIEKIKQLKKEKENE